MIRLDTLGALDLRDSAGYSIGSVLAQPKRIGLLAYVALCRRGAYCRRETLLALLWPELDEKRARAALSKALHHLRRSLGVDVLTSRGLEDIGLDEGMLWMDAVAFDDAAREGDHLRALELYRGEFLDGFHMDNAPEFERWLDGERARLRGVAAAAAMAASAEAESLGDVPSAVAHTRRALSLSSDDEPALRRLIDLLDLAGDRAGAVSVYEAFASRLREVWEVEPSHVTTELVARIRRGESRRVTRESPDGAPFVPVAASILARPVEDPGAVRLPADPFPPAEDSAKRLLDPPPGAALRPRDKRDPGSARRIGRYLPWAMTSALAVAGAIAGTASWLRPEPPQPIAITGPFEELTGGWRPFAISRNGSHLAYAGATSEGQSAIHVRRLADNVVRALAGTVGGSQPVFSPSGDWIAFVRADSVLKVPIDGGPPVLVTTGHRRIVNPPGWQTVGHPSWARDGTLLFVSSTPPDSGVNAKTAVYRVSENGGLPELLFAAEEIGAALSSPELLPNGEGVLYSVYNRALEASEVKLFNLATRETTTIASPGVHPRYVEEIGHILYGHPDQALFALPFARRRHLPTGPPVQIIRPLPVSGGGVLFDVSENGVAVYQSGVARGGGPRIALADRRGDITPLLIRPGNLVDPRFSQDGRFIAYVRQGQVYVHDIELGTNKTITSEGENFIPLWTGDGSLFFNSLREGVTLDRDVFRQEIDRSGAPRAPLQQIISRQGNQTPAALTRDGRLLVHEAPAGQKQDLVVYSLDGDSVSRTPWLEAEWSETSAALSPDERWVAYVSDEEGSYQVYVRSFPDPGARISISTSGGLGPAWSPDGKTLYYVERGNLIAATVRSEPVFEVLARDTVLSGIHLPDGTYGRRQYDVDPTGDRFVVLIPNEEGEGPSADLTLVLNWFEILRQVVQNRAFRP